MFKVPERQGLEVLIQSRFRYDKALAAAKVDGIMKSIWLGAGLAVTFLTMFSSYCLAFWLGTNWVADGSMSPNTILTVFKFVKISAVPF